MAEFFETDDFNGDLVHKRTFEVADAWLNATGDYVLCDERGDVWLTLKPSDLATLGRVRLGIPPKRRLPP